MNGVGFIVNYRLVSLASLAVAATLAGCAKAPDKRWSQVDGNVYLDPSTIKNRGGHTSAWFDFQDPPSAIFFWASPEHSLALEAIDCKEGRMAEMATRELRSGYYERGEDPEKLNFEYVTPDTVAEAMLESVCKTLPQEATAPSGPVSPTDLVSP